MRIIIALIPRVPMKIESTSVVKIGAAVPVAKLHGQLAAKE